MNNESEKYSASSKEVFCPAPWKALVLSPDGSTGACCMEPRAYSLRSNNLSSLESINGLNAKVFREKLSLLSNKENLPHGCQRCLSKEKLGNWSVRQQYIDRFSTSVEPERKGLIPINSIEHLDLSLTNICNFKCRYCYTGNSTKLFKERDYLIQKDDKVFSKTLGKNNYVNDVNSSDIVAYVKELSSLKSIELKGGEPFLAQAHKPLLEYLVTSNRAKDITLEYTTNGSIYDPTLSSYWKHFKKVILSFSIDGQGEVFKYSRSGNISFEKVVWPTFLKYLNEDVAKLSIHITIHVFNFLYLPSFNKWLEEFQRKSQKEIFVTVGIVITPRHLNFQLHDQDVINDTVKKLSKSSIESIVTFAKSVISSVPKNEEKRKELIESFKYINTLTDQYRSTDLKESLPEVWQSLFRESTRND